MEHKNGYIILEGIIGLSIMTIVIGMLYQILVFGMNVTNTIEDKTELHQQAIQSMEQIEKIIRNSEGILNVEQCGDMINLKDIRSIKCKYRDDGEFDKQNKEIIFKTEYNKIFINDLSYNNTSQSGGYEVGDYITQLSIGINDTRDIAKVKIILNKGKQRYELQKTIKILNIEVA